MPTIMPTMSSILKAASELPKDKRIEYLRYIHDQPQNTKLLQNVIQGALHPGVKWLLPRGPIQFKAAPANAGLEYRFYTEATKLDIFCEGGNDDLKQDRREKIFLQLLESIHPDDAALLCAVKDKYLPYPNLNLAFMKECFPLWFPGIEVQEAKPVVPVVPPVVEVPGNPVVNSEKPKTAPMKTNKGKVVVNDGVRNFLVDPSEAGKWNPGRIQK